MQSNVAFSTRPSTRLMAALSASPGFGGRRHRATVLIIVLGVLTILSVMGTAFARFMKTELQSTRFYALRHSVEQLAKDGITDAVAKTANVAARRHYTTLFDADWSYETNAAFGQYFFTAGNPPTGFGITRLEDTANPSFKMPTGNGPGQYPANPDITNVSGFRPGSRSTIEPNGDIYRLKVIESQSQINVRSLARQGRRVFTLTLSMLGMMINKRTGVNPFEFIDMDNSVAGKIFIRIDPDQDGVADMDFTSKEMFLETLRGAIEEQRLDGFVGPPDAWRFAEDYITTASWPFSGFPLGAPNQAFEERPTTPEDHYYRVRDGFQNNAAYPGIKDVYNLQQAHMAPLNVNTASREALFAWLFCLEGERSYLDVNRMEWIVDQVTQEVRLNERGGGLDHSAHSGAMAASTANNSVLRFLIVGSYIDSQWNDVPQQLEVLTDLILREREIRPFTSFKDFDARIISRLDTPQNGGFTDTTTIMVPNGNNANDRIPLVMPIGLAALPLPNQFLLGDLVYSRMRPRLAEWISNQAPNRSRVFPESFTPDFLTWYWESCRDLLRAALNPTPKVTRYNPDEAYYDTVDAVDVTFRAGPICFHSYGVYEITSHAQIYGPQFDPVSGTYVVRPAAEASVRATVTTMDILRHHTQQHFTTGLHRTKGNTVAGANQSMTQLTGNTAANQVTHTTVTGPSNTNEGAIIGLSGTIGGPGAPNDRFGYVQARPRDRTPYNSLIFTTVDGLVTQRWQDGYANAQGAAQHSRRHLTFARRFSNGFGTAAAGVSGEDFSTVGGSRAATTARPRGGVEPGFNQDNNLMVDGVLILGRQRRQSGANWAAPRLLYPAGFAGDTPTTGVVTGVNLGNPPNLGDHRNFQQQLQIGTNCPYYQGTVQFWIKFNDDWFGTTNSKRTAASRDVPRSAFHADSHFCGLFGATQFVARSNDRTEGVQMFIFKDVGMQLRIVRLYFGEAFNPPNVNGGRLGNIDGLLAGGGNTDTYPRDNNEQPVEPNDMGILYARVDAVVKLDRLPFPILPKHWYHFSISWDSNDSEWEEPYTVCINGRPCQYGTELVIPASGLQSALNDESELTPGPPQRLAMAAILLNELQPRDRISIAGIERQMISRNQRNNRPARLFSFAEFTEAADANRPFDLIAPANATMDNVLITTRKINTNAPAGDMNRHARYSQRPADPNFPNASLPTDGAGIYYENGFENPYNVPVQVAWMAWTEHRPRFDPTRRIVVPPFGAANQAWPGLSAEWQNYLASLPPYNPAPNPGDPMQFTMQYQRPARNVADFESDFVQIFAGRLTNRAANPAWGSIPNNPLKLNSEAYTAPVPLAWEARPAPYRRDNRMTPVDRSLNLSWYGGMAWAAANQPLILGPTDVLMYRAYFRRGERFIANNSPQNTTAFLDEVVVAVLTPPRFLEYDIIN